MNLIKDSIDKIIFPITSIINLSITSAIVPNQLKIARVRGYLNFEPGFELGSEPGSELGSEPGSELGSEPGFQPGFELQ